MSLKIWTGGLISAAQFYKYFFYTAKKWPPNPGENVKVIILTHIKRSKKQIRVEKWELDKVPNQHITRNRADATVTLPKRTSIVEITGRKASHPLDLGFKQLMLSNIAVEEGEGQEITFSQAGFIEYAKTLRAGARLI